MTRASADFSSSSPVSEVSEGLPETTSVSVTLVSAASADRLCSLVSPRCRLDSVVSPVKSVTDASLGLSTIVTDGAPVSAPGPSSEVSAGLLRISICMIGPVSLARGFTSARVSLFVRVSSLTSVSPRPVRLVSAGLF